MIGYDKYERAEYDGEQNLRYPASFDCLFVTYRHLS